MGWHVFNNSSTFAFGAWIGKIQVWMYSLI